MEATSENINFTIKQPEISYGKRLLHASLHPLIEFFIVTFLFLLFSIKEANDLKKFNYYLTTSIIIGFFSGLTSLLIRELRAYRFYITEFTIKNDQVCIKFMDRNNTMRLKIKASDLRIIKTYGSNPTLIFEDKNGKKILQQYPVIKWNSSRLNELYEAFKQVNKFPENGIYR